MISQIIAVTIFVVMFLLIVSEKIERHIVTMGCGILMLVIVFGVCMRSSAAIWEILNIQGILKTEFWYLASSVEETSAGINWATIFFIAGMMIMVEGMGRAGFFRWLCLWIAGKVKYKAVPIFITFMLMSFVLAMFIDSITVILFLAAVTVELASVDNIPFAATMIPVIKVLAQSMGVDLSVLAWTLAMGTDIGGSATPIGASANVVGISVAAKNGHIIGWGKYCKYCVPATVIVVFISMICIYVRYLGVL